MEKLQERASQTLERQGARHCPSCAAVLEKHWQFLDPRSGRTTHLYQYRCGDSVWED
ncbi:MAG TPA: hypothetical protein VFL62_17325 [Bradyrhizobium sp.]|uniref:hypothetical protein n=1 Tax=Bradyrhizobium sp. TaxID=376 RepID=UPI002D8110E9|nr:hypothetical protein [Bradyrhizobium sp.]HET7887987.1 hypothetical protein [Bradyrhizobium sp.]